MQIQKLQVALYSIGQHLQGNQLLKNPKGTPWTTVKTIEHLEYMSSRTLDISGQYITRIKDFSKKKPLEIIRFLFYNKYAQFNETTKEIDRTKHLNYLQTSNTSDPKLFKDGSKGNIPYEKLEKRNLEPIGRKIAHIKEEYLDFSMAFLGVFAVKETTTEKTYGEYIEEKYYKEKRQKAENEYPKQGFWKTLLHNLNQA